MQMFQRGGRAEFEGLVKTTIIIKINTGKQ